ncbi:MAG: DUF3347 domain-containing protein [Bacteriovoracaceae bacterium]
MKIIILLIFLYTNIVFATTLDKILPHYLEMQTALANDSLAKAQVAASDISKLKNIEENNLLQSNDKIKNAKNISIAREEFKIFSKPFVDWVQKNKKVGLIVVSCSMADAKWVQKDGEVANPYFGSEMKTCGDKLPK